MKPAFARTASFFDRVFGSCPICTRKSLVSAFAAWGACLIALLIWPDQLLLTLLVLAAAGLTALWALHVSTFAVRALVMARRNNARAADRGRADGAMALEATEFDRRAAMAIFFKAAGAAAFTSLTIWPLTLLADSHTCADGSRCHSGYKCCWNSLSDAYFCCDSSHICCTSGSSNYCRNPNANEYC